MIVGVADTHALIWYIFADPRLSNPAKTFIDNAFANSDYVGVSSITLVEIVYLIEKRRIAAESLSIVASLLEQLDSVFIEIPVDLRVARSMSSIDSAKVPDMPDRIIAATAVHLNVPLISRDGKIQISGINTIW